MGRGLDVFQLTPSEHLTQNEIDAANDVQVAGNNPQMQRTIVWLPSFSLARAYVDQLDRGNGLPAAQLTSIKASLGMAEQQSGGARQTTLRALAARLDRTAGSARDGVRVRKLAATVKRLANDAE